MKGTALVLIALVAGLLAVSGCLSAPGGPAPAPAATLPQEARPHYLVGVDGDFPPFTAEDRGGNFTGIDTDAARYVAAEEGFGITFVAVPWDTVVPSLESGKIDIIWSGMTVDAERQARVNFSVPYYAVNLSVAARAGSGLTLQDLFAGRLRVGAEAGSTEADWVRSKLIATGKMPAANLTLYPSITALTEGLGNGTVDASVIPLPSQRLSVAGRPLAIIGTLPEQERYAVAVRKGDPALLARIDDGLLRLMADSYWQQLKQEYGLGP